MVARQLLVLVDIDGCAVAVQARIRDRFTARAHAHRIDADLAAGGNPDATVAASLRARTLTTMQMRRGLACGLHKLASAAPDGTARRVPRCAPSPAVAQQLGELHELHDRLIVQGPVSAVGVARTRQLMTDGSGPLYNGRCAHELPRALRHAIDGLDVIADSQRGRV